MASKASSVPRYAAELLAAFLLTLAILASVGLNYGLPTPFVAALTLMVLAYVFGPVSGAHANPAVTLGLFSIGRISAMNTLGYVVAQGIGAVAAMALFSFMADPPLPQPGPLTMGIIGETIGTFVLAFGVTRVVLGKIDEAASGLVVGLSLLLGVTVASIGSLGVINPAVALGLNIFDVNLDPGIAQNALVYIIAPILGGVLGSWAAQWFSKK